MTTPSTTPNVGELLSSTHRKEKLLARDMLLKILSSVRYLARQGLALRKADDSESNLIQLLQLRAEDDTRILNWLAKTTRKYTSHENQNDMLNIMAQHVQRMILCDINQSPFITIMVDETTDISNKEQLTFVIRSVNEDFDVSEDFLGMYNLLTTTASSIVSAITDVLLRFQLPFLKYEANATMVVAVQWQGKKVVWLPKFGN